MKRLLLFLAFSACCASMQINAQSLIKYHGEADIAYSSGVGQLAIDRFNIHMVNGIMIDDVCSVGIGIGTDCYTYLKTISVAIPIYLDLKGYLPVTDKIQAFMGVGCGIGVGASEYIEGLKGLYLTPSVGIKFKRVKLQIGYSMQRVSEGGVGYNLGAIQTKLGVMF